MKISRLIVIAFVPLFFLGCNSTKITSSWKADKNVTRSYRSIMVWGIMAENDSSLRRKMEMHLVNDLLEKGYRAFSSVDVYKARAYNKLSEKEIVDEFKNSGVDAVITIALLSKEKENVFVPAGVNMNGADFDNVQKYYSSVYDRVFKPGYYVTATSYFWEINLFEVKDVKRVYSVSTTSFDPFSKEKLAHENGLMIIKDMTRKKVITDLAKAD